MVENAAGMRRAGDCSSTDSATLTTLAPRPEFHQRLISSKSSVTEPILGLGQLYRDRADCENVLDELKNQWGWGGLTTQDLARCRHAARFVALVYDCWNLFTRPPEPDKLLEAITSRPLLLTTIAERIQRHVARAGARDAQTQDPCGCRFPLETGRANSIPHKFFKISSAAGSPQSRSASIECVKPA
jgi:hypothetical protein